MVTRVNPDGGVWIDPPETREEIERIERGFGTPVAMIRGKPAPVAKPDPEKVPRPAKK
jgi:hypothetical protein